MGIHSKNREEWALTDLACLRNSITIVPFFESLGKESQSFIINQTSLSTLCTELKYLDTIISLKKSGASPSLKDLICFDQINDEIKQKATEAGLGLHYFWEIIEVGREHPEIALVDPSPETIYMFCYTSGTTGEPKGAMLAHSCFVTN